MRQQLRELKETDPDFWKELEGGNAEEFAAPEVVLPEDREVVDEALDDCEVTMDTLIDTILAKKVGKLTEKEEGLKLDGVAEQSDIEEAEEREEEKQGQRKEQTRGEGKRTVKPNRLYEGKGFWRHDGYTSENDEPLKQPRKKSGRGRGKGSKSK